MTSPGLLTASQLVAPSDPVDRRDWYAAIEESIAADVRRNLRRIVTDGFNAYLDTLTAAGDEAALDAIIEDWAMYVQTTLGPTYQGLYLSGALGVWMTSPRTTTLPLTAFEGWAKIVNYDALNYQATATNRLAQVGDNVWSAVNDKVLKALETGATNEELKGMIEQVTQFSEFRADTIARTETASAYNNGRYEAAIALGEYGPVAKVWDASIDARTRPAHAEAHNQTVAFDEMFDVGGEPMRGPNDPNASAANVVNCRCALLELNESDMDPDGNIWTADGPVSASEWEQMEQSWMLAENRERMQPFGPDNPAPAPLLRPGDDGWEVYQAEMAAGVPLIR